jgi:hypothetical protein
VDNLISSEIGKRCKAVLHCSSRETTATSTIVSSSSAHPPLFGQITPSCEQGRRQPLPNEISPNLLRYFGLNKMTFSKGLLTYLATLASSLCLTCRPISQLQHAFLPSRLYPSIRRSSRPSLAGYSLLLTSFDALLADGGPPWLHSCRRVPHRADRRLRWSQVTAISSPGWIGVLGSAM